MEVIKQFKTPLILFLAGILITIFGAWMKIMHMAYADVSLTAAMLLKGAAVILAIVTLIRSKRP